MAEHFEPGDRVSIPYGAYPKRRLGTFLRRGAFPLWAFVELDDAAKTRVAALHSQTRRATLEEELAATPALVEPTLPAPSVVEAPLLVRIWQGTSIQTRTKIVALHPSLAVALDRHVEEDRRSRS